MIRSAFKIAYFLLAVLGAIFLPILIQAVNYVYRDQITTKLLTIFKNLYE